MFFKVVLAKYANKLLENRNHIASKYTLNDVVFTLKYFNKS